LAPDLTVAAILLRKAGSASAYVRIFSPQSGLTHSRTDGTTATAAAHHVAPGDRKGGVTRLVHERGVKDRWTRKFDR